MIADTGFEELMKWMPLLIPILIVQFSLVIAALIDLTKKDREVKGQKWVWILVILFVNFIGPIIYFVVGRENE